MFKSMLSIPSFCSPGEFPPNETIQWLLEYSQQTALGMDYLSEKGFVHRDLAARNILVSSDNMCKVCRYLVIM